LVASAESIAGGIVSTLGNINQVDQRMVFGAVFAALGLQLSEDKEVREGREQGGS
jgi:hypothetical protein